MKYLLICHNYTGVTDYDYVPVDKDGNPIGEYRPLLGRVLGYSAPTYICSAYYGHIESNLISDRDATVWLLDQKKPTPYKACGKAEDGTLIFTLTAAGGIGTFIIDGTRTITYTYVYTDASYIFCENGKEIAKIKSIPKDSNIYLRNDIMTAKDMVIQPEYMQFFEILASVVEL